MSVVECSINHNRSLGGFAMTRDLISMLHDDFFNFPAISTMHPIFSQQSDLFVKPGGMPNPDIVEFKNRLDINIPLSGYKKEDVEVHVEDGTLVVDVKKRSLYEEEGDNKPTHFYKKGLSLSGFKWKLKLNSTIDVEKMLAKLEDGILNITLPKREKLVKKLTIT